MGQAVSYVPQHEAMSTQQRVNQVVPKHAMQLTKTSVPVAGTV